MKFIAILFLHCCLLFDIIFGQYCLYRKTNLRGRNILDKPEKVDEIEKCQERCDGNSACNFWTYNKKKKECYLKLRFAHLNKEFDADYVSAPWSCKPFKSSSGCLEENTGPKAKNVFQRYEKGDSMKACYDECKTNGGCNFWSFNENNNTCFLLKDINDIRYGTFSKVFLGAKNCTNENKEEVTTTATEASNKCVDEDTGPSFANIIGQDSEAKDENMCRESCLNKPDFCMYWSFSSTGKECYLLKDKDKSQTGKRKGFKLGSRECNPVKNEKDNKKADSKKCKLENTSSLPHNLMIKQDGSKFNSEKKCQTECKNGRATRNCKYWSFYKKDSTSSCYHLTNIKKEDIMIGLAPNYTFGGKDCPGSST